MDYMMLEPYTNEFKGFVSDEKVMDELGFTIEQVYEAYCDKNKVNYQRLESGY